MKLDDINYVLLAIILIFTLKWFINYFINLIKLPPGPWGLPIVGYIPWMEKNVAESFIEISKKYGNIFSVTLGDNTVVVLNDWQSIKASLIEQPKIFSGRPINITTDRASGRKGKTNSLEICSVRILSNPLKLQFQNLDIGFSDGPVWKEQRNVVIQCMRNAGMGKSSMESLIMESIHDVIKILSSCDGKTIETEALFSMPFMKISWKLVANKHVDDDRKELAKFNEDIRLIFQEFRPDNIYNVFPWIRFLPPNGFGFKTFIQANERIVCFLKHIINSRKQIWEEGFNNDFIDCYLSKIQNNAAVGAPYTFDHLLGSVWDMFIAGVDTVTATMRWTLLFLACNPDAQKEAQDEIDAAIGKSRLPRLDDFSKLPFVEALILEVHRLANVVPLSVPHTNLRETNIGNVTIPKGSTCIQNIYAIHLDPTLWVEPRKFNPRRFINEDNVVKSPPYFMPFSVGPRICVGKSMAELNLKLFISCLLQQFSFSLPPDQPKPSLDRIPGLTVHPVQYSLVVHVRNQ
ncbi:Cytochrome P450 2 sub R member 1 [Chamberlinius hualienensis]